MDKYVFITNSWTPNPEQLNNITQMVLDETCIAELYARLSVIKDEKK